MDSNIANGSKIVLLAIDPGSLLVQFELVLWALNLSIFVNKQQPNEWTQLHIYTFTYAKYAFSPLLLARKPDSPCFSPAILLLPFFLRAHFEHRLI